MTKSNRFLQGISMSEPDSPNPYQSPTSESSPPQKSEESKSLYANVVWLIVLPFLIAHLVYWPVFLIGLLAFGGYGITGLFMGTGAVLIAGVSYGGWLGIKVNGENLSTPSLHPAAYAVGQMFWFLISLVAPCGLFVVGAS